MNLLEEQIGTTVAIQNVLFATDFSDVSEAALPYVTALSLRYGSTVHVVHVLADVALLRPGAPDPVMFGSIYEEAHSVAQEKIQQLSKRLKGFPHKTYVRHGEVLDVVKNIIEEQKIDLLVRDTWAHRTWQAADGLSGRADLPPGKFPGTNRWARSTGDRESSGIPA